MNLTEHLMACADLWAEASGKSVARLSTIVANDGKLFARIGSMRLGVTTATLEKFADFFADAGSWPEGRIPAEVGEFIHRVAGISPEADASPDYENGDIGVPPSTDIPAPGVVGSSRPTASLLEDGGSDSLPSSIEGERLDGGTIPSAAPGELVVCPTAPLLEGGEGSRPTAPLLEGGEGSRPTAPLLEGGAACPTAALLEGGVYPLGVGVPWVTLVKVDGVALPVICPDCDLRIDDARVLQCQHAICPRRVAA